MYLPLRTLRLRTPWATYIVTCPPGAPFGPMVASIHMPMAVALAEGARLVVLAPRRSLNPDVFRLTGTAGLRLHVVGGVSGVCLRAVVKLREDVAVWLGSLMHVLSVLPLADTARQILELVAALASYTARRAAVVRAWVDRPWKHARKADEHLRMARRSLARLKTHLRIGKAFGKLRQMWSRASGALGSPEQVRKLWHGGLQVSQSRYRRQVYFGTDIRRLMATPRQCVRLVPALERRAEAAAVRVGLRPDAALVALHIREAGYRPAYTGHVERPIDQHRTARVETYSRAVSALVDAGMTVVRIGDPTMTPFSAPGVVDLATSSDQDAALLQLWSVSRSRFLFAGESGPSELALLFGVPLLQANVVNFDSNYPVRPLDRYTIKRARRPGEEHCYTLEEMIRPSFLGGKDEVDTRAYLDNTADELLAAALEMLDVLRAPQQPTPEQLAFRDLMTRLVTGDGSVEAFMRKLGAVPASAGEGVICRFFAERYLRDGALPPVSA